MEKGLVSIDDESFALNLEHAKASYSNAQEAIRFVDSKTAILTGIVVLTTGIPVVASQIIWAIDSDSNPLVAWLQSYGCAHPRLLTAQIITSFLGSLCGVLSLLASTNGMMSRLPRKGSQREPGIFVPPFRFLVSKTPFLNKVLKPASRPPVTCLFPLHAPESHGEAKQVFKKLGEGGYGKRDVLREYELQLEAVGAILNCKICRNRDAVNWFEVQILVYAIIAGSFFFSWLCHVR